MFLTLKYNTNKLFIAKNAFVTNNYGLINSIRLNDRTNLIISFMIITIKIGQ